MATYNFRWPHFASEVYVTGTFDNWSKSEKLDNTGNGFEKVVTLPSATDKISYKFVVDGNWTTDHTAPSETDHIGNINNILTAEHLTPIVQHSKPSSAIPGTFPETPLETPGQEKSFGVAPLPATSGAGNPIKLAPGEKVPEPSSFTSNTINSNVKLDKESYEKSGSAAPQLPPVLNEQEKKEAAGASIFAVPPVTGGMIPESSLPMRSAQPSSVDAGPIISSVSPQSTTAALAGQQPIEPRGAPTVVKESQQEAHASPEASASTSAVQDKSQMEQELQQKVPEAPATSSSGMFGTSEKGVVGAAAGGLAAAGAAAAGAAYAAKDKAVGPSTTSTTTTAPAAPSTVPAVVKESQRDAHVSPEATSSSEAVREKSQVETELMSKVSEAPATSSSGMFGSSEKGVLGVAAGGLAAAGTAAAGAAYAAKDKAVGPSTTSATTSPAAPATVPSVVKESQLGSHTSPEAASSPEAVKEKSQVESELKAKVPEAPATTESGFLGQSEKGYLGAAAGGVAAAGAAVAGAAYAAKDKYSPGQSVPNILPTSTKDTDPSITKSHSNNVPGVVTESQHKAHASPEAAASPEAVREKAAMEQELATKVKTTEAAGEPAPSSSAALSSTAPTSTTTKSTTPDHLGAAATTGASTTPDHLGAATSTSKKEPSRDVSPMTRPGETSAAPETAAPATPKKDKLLSAAGTPSSTKTTDSPADSKKKRKSFFGKLKDKLNKS